MLTTNLTTGFHIESNLKQKAVQRMDSPKESLNWFYGTPNRNWVSRSTLLYQGSQIGNVRATSSASPSLIGKLFKRVAETLIQQTRPYEIRWLERKYSLLRI
jgi:hypothetical protein